MKRQSILAAGLVVALVACASPGAEPFEEFMMENSFMGDHRAIDCDELGMVEDGVSCMAIILADESLIDMSTISRQVSSATATPQDRVVCSELARRPEFNCVFFGEPTGDQFPVLLVYGRSGSGASKILLALTTSALGPEDLREYLDD